MPEDRNQSSSIPTEHEKSLVEHVEDMMQREELVNEQKYPIRREELVTEYAHQEMDMPNETETLGDVFDRLTQDRYESPEEVREAILNEYTGEQGSMEEANVERSIEELEEADNEP